MSIGTVEDGYWKNPGFDPHGLVALTAVPSLDRLSESVTTESGRQRHRQLLADLSRLDGVSAVSAANGVPFGSWQVKVEVTAAGRATGRGTVVARERSTGPGYFQTLSVPLVAGRDFATGLDLQGRVVIVNASLASALFGPGSPVGRLVSVEGVTREIVGVCRDFLDEDLSSSPSPRIYLYEPGIAFDVLLRTIARPERTLAEAQATARRWLPDGFVSGFAYQEYYWRQTAPERARAGLMGLVMLVALGVSALTAAAHASSWLVEHRAAAGVLGALGAGPGAVTVSLLTPFAVACLQGVVAGLVCGVLGGRVVHSQIGRFGSVEPLAIGAAALAVALPIVAALAWPVRSMANTSVAELLRYR